MKTPIEQYVIDKVREKRLDSICLNQLWLIAWVCLEVS